MLKDPGAWHAARRSIGWRCLQAAGLLALGQYFVACAVGSASPSGSDTGGFGATGGTGGTGGSGGAGQPARTLSIEALSVETGLAIDPTHLMPGAVANILVTLVPVAEADVRFALLAADGEAPLDAVLSASEVPVDAAGRAQVTLTAPSVPAHFQVRASTPLAEPVWLDVAVEKSGFASLAVKPIHDPPRMVTTWIASAWEGVTCTDPVLQGSPPEDGPFKAQSMTFPFELKVPSDVPVAVLVRAEKFAWGCTSISAAKEGPITPVEVVLSNVPIKLDGAEFEFTLNLDEDGFIPFDAALAPYQTAIVDDVVGEAADDVEALLDEMERIADDPEFTALRTDQQWDGFVRYELGAPAGDVLRAPLADWLADGVQLLHGGGGIVAKLEGDAEAAPAITLKSVFGLSVSRSTFKVAGETSLDVDAADGMLVGASLEFDPRGLLLAAARTPARQAVDVPEPISLEQAVAEGTCAEVAATLVAHGATADFAYSECDEACVLSACNDAVVALLAYEEAPASFAVALTATALVGNDAELLGFCSGAWLGSMLLTPDDPEGPKTNVVGDANGEPLTVDGSHPCNGN
jgi:hypothetical protein